MRRVETYLPEEMSRFVGICLDSQYFDNNTRLQLVNIAALANRVSNTACVQLTLKVYACE